MYCIVTVVGRGLKQEGERGFEAQRLEGHKRSMQRLVGIENYPKRRNAG
jgi:hypothetical protein